MDKKKKGTGVVKWSLLTALSAILLIGVIIGTQVATYYQKVVNIYLGTSNFKVVQGDENEDTVKISSDYESEEELVKSEEALCAELEGEGAVLLKNNGALPLKQGASVSCFSHSSVDMVYGGTGSAKMDTSKAPTLKSALEKSGFEVNDTLWKFYQEGEGSKYPREVVDWENPDSTYAANEVPWTVYTDTVKDSFAQYGDAAVVVLSRVGGEDNDTISTEGNYLELSTEEQELLKNLNALKSEGTIKSVVVLLNTANAIEVDFLFDDSYGVDAALWIGDVGQTGLYGVADILCGNINPSGHLVDTFTKDHTTSPVMMNFGGISYTNPDDVEPYIDPEEWTSYGYVVYQEGIYVGYRYYETRYEDTVMGTGNTAGYAYGNDVGYPFGYGLSYTTFEWSDFSVEDKGDTFEAKVTVTNTGDVDGKDVVEIYHQSPYTDYDKENKVEKAAVELSGFAKTKLLKPGESQTVEISIEKSELTSYDYTKANTYILDAGDYYFTAGESAHDAVNNILAAKGYNGTSGMDADGNAAMTWKWTNEKFDDTTYATASTGYAITNQFEDADLNKYSGSDTEVTYLSRSDWNGTFPEETISLAASTQMLEEMHSYEKVTPQNEGEMPTLEAKNGLSLPAFIGKDYDDPEWQELLDQLTFDEMAELIGIGYHATNAVESVGKPETKEENGPQGLTALLTHGASGMAYTSEDIMAATWNVELIEQMGKCIGEDCLNAGYSGLYGPGANMHRSPYGGRNFEYYSEDSFLAGTVAATEVRGIQSKGVYAFLKHFAMNEQETNRIGVTTWANEQSIRELYLVPFEKAIVDGGAHCVMSSFNRIGTVWTGAHKGLMVEILRNEFGMDGIAITDYAASKYMNVVQGLLNGSTLWDCSDTDHADLLKKDYSKDPQVVEAMKEATHRILYTVVNSNAMNGMSPSTQIVAVLPWWKKALYALHVVLAAALVASIVMLVKSVKRKRQAKAGA